MHEIAIGTLAVLCAAIGCADGARMTSGTLSLPPDM